MARLPRFVIAGHPQHVIIRGNNRDSIFYADEDYRFYLKKLKQACDKHQCDVHAYVLMTNHVHLLLTPRTTQGISKAMQMLGRYYVQYFNNTCQRTGTLWEGRYKATLIDSERYLLTCYRYIELNPVRAEGMASHHSEYRWSSYHYNALGQEDTLVTPHTEYLRSGKQAARHQQHTGHYLNRVYPDIAFKSRVAKRTLAEIRQATNNAWVLGGGHFKVRIEQQLGRRAAPVARGGDRKSKTYQKTRINGVRLH